MSTSKKRSPQCVVYVGPMGSGKSLKALRWARRRGAIDKVVFATSTRDTRSKQSLVESRNGCSAPAVKVELLTSIPTSYKEQYAEAHALVIDEAQFFNWDDLIAFVESSLSLGKDVCIAGLDTDRDQKPFLPLAELHRLATSLTKLTACCKQCDDGTEAGHTIYIPPEAGDTPICTNATGNTIKVGNAGYQPACYYHLQLHRTRSG